ncbi:MAG: hypothetical protein QOG53_292 [Frankiales bacterium]|jgi:hypothetical protein|nr:hypothetical protein [Frankiales bacterium]
MEFGPATVSDPIIFGAEPAFHFDSTNDERSFVDFPIGSSSNTGILLRSTDGSKTFIKRYASIMDASTGGPGCAFRQVPYCQTGGGGDTDLNVNPTTGSVSFSSQEAVVQQAVGVSLDHGVSFPNARVSALPGKVIGVDRQWQASWKGTQTRFIEYHVPAAGIFVNRSDDEGLTWAGGIIPAVTDVAQTGAMATDNTGGPHNHTLYVSYLSYVLDNFKPGVVVSTDGGATWTKHLLEQATDAGTPRNFVTMALDTAGNAYVTWVDGDSQHTYLSVSKADVGTNVANPGSQWTKPVRIDSGLNVTIFPYIVAGSAGRIAVGFYGTTAAGPTPDDVAPGQAGWYPYVVYSDNALCGAGTNPCAAPTFHQSKIAHRINQDDQICTAGTACAADPTSNRNLADYFGLSLDNDGHIGVVWDDTNNETKMPFAKVARQVSGPSLYAGKPNATGSVTGTNGQSDLSNDAKYPIAGTKLLTSKSQNGLDLLGSRVFMRNKDFFEVRMKVKDLGSLSTVVPGGGSAFDDSGTHLAQARYITRWDFGGQSYYVAGTVPGGSNTMTFGAGTVSLAEAIANGVSVNSTDGNNYKPLTSAHGEVQGDEIVVDVPVASVGSVTKGSSLISVQSFSMLGGVDTITSLQQAAIVVDGTPAFDTSVPNVPAGVGPPAAGTPGTGGGGSGGGLATTGAPYAVGVVALALLVAAGVVRRRVTR